MKKLLVLAFVALLFSTPTVFGQGIIRSSVAEYEAENNALINSALWESLDAFPTSATFERVNIETNRRSVIRNKYGLLVEAQKLTAKNTMLFRIKEKDGKGGEYPKDVYAEVKGLTPELAYEIQHLKKIKKVDVHMEMLTSGPKYWAYF
ncbi:MAG TPA: hypothetical protein VGE18_00745 [Candidatus Paceibacterota bacterium]